jgi:hypothetical protein
MHLYKICLLKIYLNVLLISRFWVNLTFSRVRWAFLTIRGLLTSHLFIGGRAVLATEGEFLSVYGLFVASFIHFASAIGTYV